MKPFLPIAAACALILILATSVMSQSLGELARREEARRLSIAQPAKVYTNESLGVESAAPAATPTPSRVVPADRTAQQPSNVATEPPSNLATQPPSRPATQDESDWHQRIDEARAALARANILTKALQSYLNALSTDFASRDDPAQRSVIASDRQHALVELERMQQEVQGRQKTIADIEEQARRAGVPPGWVR
jgi:hypothetical protein